MQSWEAIASRSKQHRYSGLLALLLGARTLLGAPGIATGSKDASRLEAIASRKKPFLTPSFRDVSDLKRKALIFDEMD